MKTEAFVRYEMVAVSGVGDVWLTQHVYFSHQSKVFSNSRTENNLQV